MSEASSRSELQRGEPPVEHLVVGIRGARGRVDQRAELEHAAAAVGQRNGAVDVQLAVERVALVHRTGVVAGLPAEHRDKVGQQPRRLRHRQADGVAAVHQPLAAHTPIMVRGSDIQGQPGQLRSTADDVGGAVQHRTRDAGVEMRPGHPGPVSVGVPPGRRIGRRQRLGPDRRQVFRVAGVGRGAHRQHRAAVEIEHQPADAVDGGHPQRRQPGRHAAGFGRVLLQTYHLGAGEQGVADDREAVKRQSPVEQVGLDPLGDQRALTDRHIAHQRRMSQRARRPGDGRRQFGVQGQPQPVADDRLVGGRRPGRQRYRRGPVENLADPEVVEIWAV